jgi:type 1 fimbria pilin
MRQIRIAVFAVVVTTLVAGTMGAAGKHATVKGYVIDSSCSFTKDLKKPISPDCAVACAKAGSPLVIQADGGTIYLPISSGQPASGQNDKLMPFAGQRVTVSGTVYEKGGARALVIEKIGRASEP